MVIYRPHRGSLIESMEEAREFNNIEELKGYITRSWRGLIQSEDIVINDEKIDDERINWDGVYMVLVKRIGSEDYMQKYGCPQCIGWCSYGYVDAV